MGLLIPSCDCYPTKKSPLGQLHQKIQNSGYIFDCQGQEKYIDIGKIIVTKLKPFKNISHKKRITY